MRKDPRDVVAELTARLERNLVAYVAEVAPWPGPVPLGEQSKESLEASFAELPGRLDRWRRWASGNDVELVWTTRRAHAGWHEIPTHVVIPDLDAAARVCAGPWPARLRLARARADALRARFGHLDVPEQLSVALRAVLDLDAQNFELTCQAGAWFAAAGDTSRLTPRQVPLLGVHAKWLQRHTRAVALLAGLPKLVLAPPHPARVHFTYLDPQHLADGGRRFDSLSIGDAVAMPYRPRVVLISENKDTAINFPPMAGAVSVEGDGSAAGTLVRVDWISAADNLVYWGDIDTDGLMILNQLRRAGLNVQAMLMDDDTYDRWHTFGTDVDRFGRELAARTPEETPFLTAAERALYERLCSRKLTTHRRLEQERIPLDLAAAHLAAIVA